MSECVLVKSPAWYVVQTKPKQEFRALEHLQNQGYDCFLPTLEVEKVCRGKLAAVMEPLFSRYLFVQLNTMTSNWSAIRSTRGVSKLVSFGERPAILPDACIDALRQAPVPPRALFEPGERVRVVTGPFAALEGIYEMANGEERAMVLLELMGQTQKMSFAVEALRKAA